MVKKLKLKYDWRLLKGERYFEVDRTFKTKANARKAAKRIRKHGAGRKARVVKVGGKWRCLRLKKNERRECHGQEERQKRKKR